MAVEEPASGHGKHDQKGEQGKHEGHAAHGVSVAVRFGPVKTAKGAAIIPPGMDDRYVFDFSEGTRARPRAARRQGDRPRRDDGDRDSRPGRLHGHDRGLRRLHAGRKAGSRRPGGGGRGAHGSARGDDGQAVRRSERPAPRLGALRSRGLDARDDGHDPQPRAERRGRRGARARDREPAFRLRRVPAADPDVRRRRRRSRRAALRGGARRGAGQRRRGARRRARGRRSSRSWSGASSRSTARTRARTFRRTRATSSPPRSARSSTPGTLPRARAYRRAHGISDDLGTAVNVVQMVFGNKGEESGTGVAFTRDPATGEQGLYGEFLANAQGEDVVAGVRTPQPLEELGEQLPRRLRGASRHHAPARAALPRRAGHRVHDRGRQALPPADAAGEAPRARRW